MFCLFFCLEIHDWAHERHRLLMFCVWTSYRKYLSGCGCFMPPAALPRKCQVTLALNREVRSSCWAVLSLSAGIGGQCNGRQLSPQDQLTGDNTATDLQERVWLQERRQQLVKRGENTWKVRSGEETEAALRASVCAKLPRFLRKPAQIQTLC